MEHGGETYLVIGNPVPRPACLVELTPSELDVIDRWLGGASMREIAMARNAAVRTVANQIASSYRKLGVDSRARLLRLLHGRDDHRGRK